MASDPRTLAVAEITAPHGIRGAVRARLYDPDSKSLVVGRVITLGEGGPTATIDALSPVPGRPLVRLQLRGVDSREAAEALRGRKVLVDRGDLEPLDEEEFYLADTIGLAVVRRREGGAVDLLGRVVGVTTNNAQDLLEVRAEGPGGARLDWLLPVVPGFIVEIDERHLWVDLPLGLLPDALEPGEPT